MIPFSSFSGRIVAVLGLGRSGLSAAHALMQSRAEVWAWDDDAAVRATGARAGVPLVDLTRCDWSMPNTLVLSPGIPHTYPRPHPVVTLSRDAGCEVIGDIEMLARAQRDATFIGVTGTNGKSTTTALLGHILNAAGRPTQVGGNIGVPVLNLQPAVPGGLFVLEVSSYQLELSPSLTFDVAVLLNISADHLEHHGGMAGYVAAKTLIFRGQTADATAVVGVDDEPSRAIFEKLRETGERAVIPISGGRHVTGGVHATDGVLRDASAAENTAVLDLRLLAHLPGGHNWQNAAAAFAAARAVGVPPHAIASGIQSFPGLRHRQEPVATIDGVTYVNDSKATNPDAAAKALACYDNIYWIAGGRAKEGGLEAMEPYLERIRHAFLIGEAADAFAAALTGKVALSKSGSLEAAVAEARALAPQDGRDAVVLLSPACASFDQFDNFEDRGDVFRALVGALRRIEGS